MPYGLLDDCVELRVLSLDYNLLNNISPDIFSNASNLINLKWIMLKYNNLTSLDSWPLVSGCCVPGVKIDLEGNPISEFISISHSDRNETCPTQLDMTSTLDGINFKHMKDIVDGWAFNSTSQFIDMFTRENSEFHLELSVDNVVYNCTDYFLASEMERDNITIFGQLHCTKELSKGVCGKCVTVYKEQPERLTCAITSDCSANCTCTDIPHRKALLVNCSSTDLLELPKVLPALPRSDYAQIVYCLRVKLHYRFNIHFDRDECIGENTEYDFFLTYAENDDDDRALAERIRTLLTLKGYNEVCDIDDCAHGWTKTGFSENGIRRSKRVVILLSSAFLAEPLRVYDNAFGIHCDAKIGRHRVIVVNLEPIEDPKSELERIADNPSSKRYTLVRHHVNTFPCIDFTTSNATDRR